jgi:hypothetical protein
MKAVWSILFSLVIVGVLAYAALRLRESRAAAVPPDSALSRLDERLQRLERSLGKLDELEREIARLRAREARVARDPVTDASPAVKPPAETARAEEPVADGDVAEAPNKLERWLEANGMREEMEVFIARNYEQARNARLEREREQAGARQREMEEFSQGPYGKHNYRVNLLTRRLGLDGRQMGILFNLLTQYDDRVGGLRQEYDLAAAEGGQSTPEQLNQHLQQLMQSTKGLREGLENDFTAGLSAEQQDAYKGLPPDERLGGPGGEKMVFFQRGIDVMMPPLKLQVAPAAPPAPAGR